MFGRKARIPIDLMYGFNYQREAEPNEYVADLQKTRSSVYGIMRDNMNVQHERQKEYYNRKVHGQPYNIGDRVWFPSSLDWPLH